MIYMMKYLVIFEMNVDQQFVPVIFVFHFYIIRNKLRLCHVVLIDYDIKF